MVKRIQTSITFEREFEDDYGDKVTFRVRPSGDVNVTAENSSGDMVSVHIPAQVWKELTDDVRMMDYYVKRTVPAQEDEPDAQLTIDDAQEAEPPHMDDLLSSTPPTEIE